MDCLCITSPTTATPGLGPRICAGLLALLLVWLWLPIVLVVLVCPLCLRCTHRDRCAWALREWGSDHLPVLVTLAPPAVTCAITLRRDHLPVLAERAHPTSRDVCDHAAPRERSRAGEAGVAAAVSAP